MKAETEKTYKNLFKHGRYVQTLQGIVSLLDWDQETHMPEAAAEIRSEQLKAMAGLIHKEKVSRKFADSLGKLIDIKTGHFLALDLPTRHQSAVKEWRRDYLIEKALPKRFVEDFAKLSSNSILAWRDARKESRFSSFAPYLKKIIAFNRKKADYLGYEKHPYDALIDLYEPGMTSDAVANLFEKLKLANVALLKKIVQTPEMDNQKLCGRYSEEGQLAFSKKLLEAMGYDFKRGRLDLSTHPFSSSSHPTDSRITTRLNQNNIFDCLSTVLHEGGHSLYEMGLPIEQFGSPLCQAISMGIHESQSRFWETRIGLCKPFVRFVLPLLQKEFPSNLRDVEVEYCYRAINKVKPSFIRVEADEVTYPLHVILRFEIEKALVEGSLKVEDLPSAWNEKMQSYLGISPKTDREGCLQDIHWAMGAIGYFPTYALGNLYAAQIFDRFAILHPDWEEKVSKGDFSPIRNFLHENVYRYGREYRSLELLRKITGKEFNADDYITYLATKYKKIYSFS